MTVERTPPAPQHLRASRAVACVGLVLALAACGRPAARQSTYTDTQAPPEEPLVLAGEVGSYGGRFVTAALGAPPTFNPVTSTSVFSRELISRMFVPLAAFDYVAGTVVPVLATAWERSEDGLAWTFHLRRGAKFSDGRPITSADVQFTFDAMYDKRVNASLATSLSSDGRPWTVTVRDPLTVVIASPTPVGSVPLIVSQLGIVPKHVLESALRDGTFATAYGLDTPPEALVTSGAWTLKAFAANERTVLSRNPYWFGVDTKGQRLPYLDDLTYLIVADQAAANLKFRAGELDAWANLAPGDVAWYEEHEKEGAFTLWNAGPTRSIHYMVLNRRRSQDATSGRPAGTPPIDPVKTAWFDQLPFRRAVSLAIDRDAMVKSVFFGEAVKNWSSATAGLPKWHLPDLQRDDYNPTEAKRLLTTISMLDRDSDGIVEDTGGHPVSFTLQMSPGSRERVAMGNFIRDDLSKVGIQVVVAPDGSPILTTKADVEALVTRLNWVVPDPSGQAALWKSTGLFHHWHPQQRTPGSPEEARVDALMNTVMESADEATRKEAFTEVQRIGNEQAWVVWLPVPVVRVAVRAKFGNVHPDNAPGVLAPFPEQIYLKRASTTN